MAVVPDNSRWNETAAGFFECQLFEVTVKTPFFKISLKFFQAQLLFADKSRVYKLIVFRNEKKDFFINYRVSCGRGK